MQSGFFFLQLLILSFINGMWPKGSDSTEQSSKKVLIFPPIFVFILSSCKMKQGCSSGVEIQPLYNLSIFYSILDTVFIEAPSFSNVLGVESILKETPFQICPKGLYRISWLWYRSHDHTKKLAWQHRLMLLRSTTMFLQEQAVVHTYKSVVTNWPYGKTSNI